ncbi:DNA repair protein RecO [Desulfothermobacter acidiphilus]|uniref:DNA repair protein RecO n=1 Tax=Desulfothermobacter acidiphilus TaxID=1938353 RepID=UPI003F88D568
MFCSGIEGVVLRMYPLREADRLLTIFSLQRGKLTATAFGGARPCSRKRVSTLPFCRARFWLQRRGEYYRVDQAESLEFFPALHQPYLLGYAGYLAELVEGFSPLEEPNPALYRLLVSSLRCLRLCPELVAQSLALKLLRLAGVAPAFNRCSSCQRPLDPNWDRLYFTPPGGLLCSSCYTVPEAPPRALSRGSARLLRALGELPLQKVLTLKAAPATLEETEAAVAALVTFHLGHTPRSLLYLQNLATSSGRPEE